MADGGWLRSGAPQLLVGMGWRLNVGWLMADGSKSVKTND